VRKVETYVKVSSKATSEDEAKKEVKIKLEGAWELDGTSVNIQVVLKGTQFDMDQLFEQNEVSPGEELKIIIREGAQASLSQFDEEREEKE